MLHLLVKALTGHTFLHETLFIENMLQLTLLHTDETLKTK